MRSALLLCCAALAWSQTPKPQGTTPKANASEYEVHDTAKSVDVGAEFMVHSVLTEGDSAVVKDYLVVEVALFPQKGDLLKVEHSAFQLRLNGKVVPEATAQMVALAMQQTGWNPGGVHIGGGLGPAQNPGYGRFPGPRVPMPQPPTQEERAGIDRPEHMPSHALVVTVSLPEGSFDGPVSGYVYYPYKGKTASIQSLELVYNDTVLKLR